LKCTQPTGKRSPSDQLTYWTTGKIEEWGQGRCWTLKIKSQLNPK
jgi:hypothetical protein